MAAEVSADLTLIQDEDILRRMWAETEDFGRKKEIRARMYKLREQRLKDFYTTGEVVTEITGRKHATTTHTESIGDQGFLSMKSKEIRDSESPTRDFSRRANNGYWTSVEERGYTTGTQDGSAIERSEESRSGEGMVVEGNIETRMAMSSQNLHEKECKSDDTMSIKSETKQQNQAFATSVSENNENSSRFETSETQNSQLFKKEESSETSASSTKISQSSTSSSRRVVSSSVTSNYQVTGDVKKSLTDNDMKSVTTGDDNLKFSPNLRANEQTNIHESNRQKSTIHHDDNSNLRLQQFSDRQTNENEDFNITTSSTHDTYHDSRQHNSQHTDQTFKTQQSYSTYSTTSENDQDTQWQTDVENRTRKIVDSRSNSNDRVVIDSTLRNKQDIHDTKNIHHETEISELQNQMRRESSDVNELRTNAKFDVTSMKNNTVQSVYRTETSTPVEEHTVEKYTTMRDVSNDTRNSSTIQSQTHSNTDEKILNEIHKLDTYLLNQNMPAPSEPSTPKSVTDGAQWTIVSNRDGEFVYQNEKTPRDNKPQVPIQPKEPAKHPSSLDLPKDATDGQYLTTYQQSYSRISVDNSPSHEFFVKTLRASPDRLTPSPTKSSRGSLDRNSPDRRLRATSKGSLDRSSPENSKRRSFSKGSLDRTTPERTYRTSPSKTPDRERRGSSESYTIEKKKDSRRKTTEITQQIVRDTTNKTKRKFSSTQQKAANKTRVSTPGVSPSTSPTRSVPKKEITSGSESDISQATYNKTSSISSFRDESLLTSKTDKRERITDSAIDAVTTTNKSKPRDRSPEYSSEGSVCREINKPMKTRSDISAENNSFIPIKQTIIDNSNDNFILEEKINMIHDNYEEMSDSTDKKITLNRENFDVLDQVTDINEFQLREDLVADHEEKLLKKKTTAERLVIDEKHEIKQNVKQDKSLKPGTELRPRETNKPKPEKSHSKSYQEIDNDKTDTETIKNKTSTERFITREQYGMTEDVKKEKTSISSPERRPKEIIKSYPDSSKPYLEKDKESVDSEGEIIEDRKPIYSPETNEENKITDHITKGNSPTSSPQRVLKDTKKSSPEKTNKKPYPEKGEDSVDNVRKLIQNKTSVTDRLYGSTEHTRKGKSPASSHEQRPKEIKKTSPETTQPKPSQGRNEQPINNERKSINLKTSTDRLVTHEKYEISELAGKGNSPTSSPERRPKEIKKSIPETVRPKSYSIKPKDSLDNEGKLIKNKTLTDKLVTEEEYEITENVKKVKSPASSPQRHPKDTNKSTSETSSIKSLEKPNDLIDNDCNLIKKKTSTDKLITDAKHETTENFRKGKSPTSSPERFTKVTAKSSPEHILLKSYSDKPKDLVNSDSKLINNKTSTARLVTDEQYEITEHVRKGKSPTSSPERRPKEKKKSSPDATHPKTFPKRDDDLSETESNVLKSMTSVERLTHEEYVITERSPTSSPERRPKEIQMSSPEAKRPKSYPGREDDSTKTVRKVFNNKTSTDRLLTHEQYEITENLKMGKSPTSSPDRRSNEIKNTRPETSHSKSYLENTTTSRVSTSKIPSSPDRKPKDLSNRQPLRQINQKRATDSPSVIQERKQKVLSPITQVQNKKPQHSPSNSPERHHKPVSKSSDRSVQKKTLDENRRSVSSSPERRLPQGSDVRPFKSNQDTLERFITEEQITGIRDRSLSISPERTPSNLGQKVTSKKSPDSRQQRPSPSSSPERGVSPDRKIKSIQPKQNTAAPTTTVPTTQRTVQKIASKETVRTTRYSSIPRANKVSPRSSKDKIEPINKKTHSQITRRPTSVPKNQQTIKVTSVTRTTNRATEKREETDKPSLIKSTNISRKPVESLAKRTPSKIATPKYTPNKLKPTDSTTSNKPAVQKIAKTGPSPKTPVNKQRTSHTPVNKTTKITKEIEVSEVVELSEGTTENIEFLNKERSILDLEDENPPEEFYAEYDEKTDETGSPDRQPKSVRNLDDMSLNVSKTTKTVSKTAKTNEDTKTFNKKNQKTQDTITKTTRKTSRKVKKERKVPQDSGSSSSSSSSEEEDTEQIEVLEDQTANIVRNEQITHASNQDLLTVVVQHPKSSRESSPGYPSVQPFCTTSEDGESNPRYADYISEPDDDAFDKNRGFVTPIRLTDDTTEVKSVADRVNVFLEATRMTQETIHQPEVLISSPKSVLKAKTMFENIAKNQTLSSSNQHSDTVPKSPMETLTSKYPSGHVIDQHKISTQKEKNHGNMVVNATIETTHIQQDTTKSFIEDEILSQALNDGNVPSKEHPQPLKHTNKPSKEQLSNRKFPEKQPIRTVVDVTTRKDFFERGEHEDVEILEELKNNLNNQGQKELSDEETEEVPYSSTETTPKRIINKQKSPSPQRQMPKAASNVTADTKKPIDRKPSGTTEIRKQLFENTTEEIEVCEEPNLKRATGDSTVRKQSSKTDITRRRSSLKEKSPSPQRNIPKQREPIEARKPFERKPSGHVVDVSSKKDFFERKVKDVSISAAKSTSKVKAHSPHKPKFTSPTPETQTTERGKETKQQSHSKSTIDRSRKSITPDRVTTKKIDNEEQISETISKISYSEEIQRKFSKTEEMGTDISETELHKLNKSETAGRRIPFDNEQSTRKISKTEDTKRKVSKPEEIVRKPSKPQEIGSVPSKPDDILRTRQIEESKSHMRNESYMRSTTSSSVRGQTPEKQPSEVTRKISKPEEISRKPSKPEEVSKKPSKPEEVIRKLSKPEEIIRKPSSTEVYVKTSTTRTVNNYASEHQKNESIRKPSKSDVSDVKTPKTQNFPITSHLDDSEHVDIHDDLTDDVEITQSRGESYMRSTVSSSARGQTPEKQFRGSTPEGTPVQNRPQTPIKSEDSRRRPSEAGEVFEETSLGRTSIRTETKQQEVGGKFGVTLRKTPSASKITTKTTVQRQNSKPGETVDIESIFDLELLEEMLLKAVGYDDRRRIRSQIRIVKKQIEDEKNTTVVSRITKTTSIQSTLPSVKAEKRQASPSRSPERREQVHRSPRSSPERHEQVRYSPRSSPERRVKSGTPEKQSPERSPIRRFSTEKALTNGHKDSRRVTETTTVRTQSVKKSATTDVKETSPTDLITSSYGVGPTDENGKPLFGLKALRRTSTNKTLIDETIEHETVTEEEKGSNLFGLKALQTESMPAESGQLRELVERHQQYVRESSAKELQPVQKPKAKLRDSFILTQDDDSTTVLNSGTDDTHKGLSLKSIIQKHENNTGSNVQTSMESRSTVVKSHSTVSSDGKVSVHRDVIHGEVSSKNNEEPVGKITRSSYSYQSPKGKDSVPSITSSTTTSLIGSRRNSGPKIEEITDSSTSNDTNRRYSKEYIVEEAENVSDQRRTSGFSVEENVKTYTSILKNSNESSRRLSGPRITDVSDVNSEHGERKASVTKTISSRASPDIQESQIGFSNRQQSLKKEERTETPKKVVTRGDSVKALQHKFQQATEAANQPTSRPYPRAGLILRSNTLQHIDDQTQTSSSIKQSSVERTSSKSKQESKLHDVPSSPVLKTEVITQEDSEVVETTQISRPEEPTSFLDNRTKVTGVQDILTRMRNADLVTEKTDSSEDAEARALLNKFLGASVILQGMEQGMRAAHIHTDSEGSPTSPSSAALVIQAEKQRVKATAVRTVEDDIDDINDEKQLRILLEACSDYEGRRKLRARLRTIMAEQKGGSEDVEESHGEFLGLRNIDDSGIESGEDLKGVNPEVMKEVEEALVRLECILPGLDASRREAVSKLVTSLQSCLRLPPKRRVTIGVSAEELAAARKWFKPPLERMVLEHVNYHPIHQRLGYLMEPAPQKAVLSYIPKTEKSLSDSGSLQDYDPSLRLFTPEQTVQIAIHKAAIKKQISQEEEKRRESSDDGDVSSGEESCEVNKYNEVSSAQRLLQIAAESAKKNPSAARFHSRSSKKLKMKRANTIDIPKPANFYEYSSGDEYGASADEVSIDVERKHQNKEMKFLPPTFEPKTENDLKFLAFLKQVNENQPKMQTYNPSARGGKHWSNRFSSIKTTFENTEQPKMSVPSPAKMFWQNNEAHQYKEYKDQYKNKLPWTVKTNVDGVVVGSLTVAKPGHVNNFNHAPKSAFKPIEKKPVSTISGTVKQIAAQKFSVSDGETEKKQEKAMKKQTNTSHPHSSYSPNTKQNTFVNNSPSAFKKYNTSLQSNHNLPVKSFSKVSAPLTCNNNSYENVKSVDASHFNNDKTPNYKKHNPPQNKLTISNLQNNTKAHQYTSTPSNSNYGHISKTQQNTLAAKKQFLQSSANIIPQNTEYKPSSHIGNPKDGSYLTLVHTINSSNNRNESSIGDSASQNNDYEKSSHTITSKKSGYNIPYHISDSQNNGYQPSLHDISSQKSMHHTSNEVVTSHVTEKPIYNSINDSCKYPYSSNVFPDAFVEEDYKHSTALHIDKRNFQKETNDLSILGDSKSKGSKGDIFPENRYSDISKNNESFLKHPKPQHFEKKAYNTYIYSSNNTANSTDSFEKPPSILLTYNEKPNYTIQAINNTPPLIKEELLPPSSPYNLSLSSSLDRISPTRLFDNKLQGENCYLSPSYQSVSPSLRLDEDDSPWGSVTNGDDSPLEEKAVSRVMGQAQCQQAVTVNNRTRRRFDADLESELKLQVRQSAQKKSLSPSFPNVIQKSESWHQMVKEQMLLAKQAPPLPKISRAKSSHTLSLPKQFEAALPLDTLSQKKITVSQYLSKQSKPAKSTKTNPKYKSTNTINIQREDDELDNVDEVFESIFQESNKKRNKCSESSSEVFRKGDSIVKTEVHSRTTTSSARLTKANSVQSPFAKFRQLERQNSAPSAGRSPPLFKFTEPKLAQSASTIKERLLSWVQAQTRHYKNIQIENFSTSWSNGLAFCALIHHFCPHAFDYDSLTPEKSRYNFELAFRVAEEEADIFPLLDVEDMVVIKKPDWKCVFTYVQSIYRRFHDSPDALPVF